MGLDWVGMFSSAVWATVLSLGMSVIVFVCLFDSVKGLWYDLIFVYF